MLEIKNLPNPDFVSFKVCKIPVAPLAWVPWVPGNPSSFEQWVPEPINFGKTTRIFHFSVENEQQIGARNSCSILEPNNFGKKQPEQTICQWKISSKLGLGAREPFGNPLI